MNSTLDPDIYTLTSHIRIAKLHDAQAIAQSHIRSWQKMYREFIPESILMDLSIVERTQQWHDLIKQGVNVLVIEVNRKIVGFSSFCTFRDGSDSSIGEISAIYLDPEYWRMGLGKKLCAATLSELKVLGYKKVYLWVLEGNIQAQKFYNVLGFSATDTSKLEEFYEGGALLREVLYQKAL